MAADAGVPVNTGAATAAAPGTTSAPTASTSTATEFYWEHTSEPWHVLAYLVLALGLAWWSWRRYGPAPAGAPGWIARLCRAAALVLVVAMIAGPAWRTTATTVLPGSVLVAIDRSASMARPDLAEHRARSGAAGELYRELTAVAAERHLLLDYQSIGGVSGAIGTSELATGTLSTPGATSPLADELARLVANGRPDLLVVVSDGRVTEGSALDSLAEPLRARELQVAVLATGGDTLEPELWIDDVAVNAEVALGEIEPVLVRGSARALPPGPITVRLTCDDQPPQTQEVTPPAVAGDNVVLRPFEAKLDAVFHREGPAKLRVEVQQGDHKDVRELTIQVRERKLQVLLLTDRPRYEWRYLREALRRDHTVTVHAYSAEGKWRRWGGDGPDHLPLGTSELRDYDVVMIGDIGPDTLADSQLTALETAVRKNGSGLIWLPGESGATAGFAKHKLGALLPVDLPSATDLARGYLAGEPRKLQRTPAAIHLGLLDSGGTAWKDLPELLGAAPVTMLKPGAEVLVEDQDQQPIVVTRGYGAGRSIFIGVDDTWRWRRNVGDRYLTRFHSQLLRFAAAGRRLSSHEWRLSANPRRAVPGEVVIIDLSPIGPTPEAKPDSVTVRLKGPNGGETLLRLLPESGGFSARLPAPTVGTWHLDVADGPEARQVEEGELLVMPPTSEMRDPRADLPALEALARGTGGQVFTDAKQLVASLPDVRKTRIENLPPAGLWDNGWAFVALLALWAVEWSLRRWFRLP